jgi:diguanylate cyclase (GGDEF)-like protein
MALEKNFQKRIETDKFLQILAGFNNFATRKKDFSKEVLNEQNISRENRCIREFNFLHSEKNELFYKQIVEKISDILEVKKSVICLIDKEKNEMFLEESFGFSVSSICVDRIKDYENKKEIQKILKVFFNTEDLIYSYIELNGKIIGLIGISEKNNFKPFNIEDFNSLSLCCGQIAYSVENNTLIRELHLKANIEEIVNKATSSIRSSLKIEEVLSNAVKAIKDTFNIEKCSVIKICENKDRVLIADLDRTNLKTFSIPIDYSFDSCPVSQELLKRKSVISINDIGDYVSQKRPIICLFSDLGYSQSLLIFPLIAENKLKGMILISEFDRDREWKNREKILMEKISSALSTAIDQADVVEGIKKLAAKDELTGLINRRSFVESFNSEVERVKRNGQALSFALLDIDYFKLFNDKWGHLAGDYVLSQIGELIKLNIRKSDIAARYGGEEFALILPETSVEKAYELLDRLRTTISKYDFNYEGTKLSISISAGVMQLNDFNSENADTKEFINESIKMADALLYKAKDLGRNNVCSA